MCGQDTSDSGWSPVKLHFRKFIEYMSNYHRLEKDPTQEYCELLF